MSTDNTDKNPSDLHDYFNQTFDSTRYTVSGAVEIGDGKLKPQRMLKYFDGSDAFANLRKMVISIQHVPSGRSIYFKAFIENFVETFNPNWKSEHLYGRADPIHMYENTERSFSLRYAIPAATAHEAYENLGKVQKLTQFLYPNYTALTNPHTGKLDLEAQTISQSPLLRLKVMNLAQQAGLADSAPAGSKKASEHYKAYTSDPASSEGLLGVLKNLTIEHNLQDKGAFVKGPNTILPKLLNISFDFSVIHEHALGWDEENNFGAGGASEAFPYGVKLEDPFKEAMFHNPNLSPAQIIEKLEQDNDQAKAQAALEEAQAKFNSIFTGAPNAMKAAGIPADKDVDLNASERDYLVGIQDEVMSRGDDDKEKAAIIKKYGS